MAAEFEPIRATANRLAVSGETVRLWAVKGFFPGAFRAPIPGSEWRIPKGAVPDFEAAKPKRPARRTVRRV